MASISVGAIAGLASAGASAFSASQQAGAAKSAARGLYQFSGPGADAANMLKMALGTQGPAGSATALNAFQGSPGYQWQKQQGIDAIQNSASNTGGVVSGNTLKALQSYGQGLASQDWWNWIGQLLNLERIGASAAGAQGDFQTQAANAAGAGAVGATNALTTNLLPYLLNNSNSNIAPLNSTLNNIQSGALGTAQGLGYYDSSGNLIAPSPG